MKKNVPKFVLAKNEAATPGAIYIVHTQEPSFIAEIKRFGSAAEQELYISENSGSECIEIGPMVLVEIKKYLHSPNPEQRKESLHKRVKDWVVSNYLISSAEKTKT